MRKDPEFKTRRDRTIPASDHSPVRDMPARLHLSEQGSSPAVEADPDAEQISDNDPSM